MTSNDDGYKVGYGRPPQASRFQKGRSGNPKGRARGSRNLAEIILGAVRETVTITENGQRKKVTKFEAALKQIANRAASGDLKASSLMLSITQPAEARVEGRQTDVPASESDKEILREFVMRFKDFTKEDSIG